MLTIRLQRIGKKHQPSYRLVVAEKRSKLAAPPVEDLGSYNPKSKATTINKERVSFWIGKGAKPTTTTHNLLVKEGALTASKVQLVFKQKVVVGAAAGEPTPVAETPSEETPA